MRIIVFGDSLAYGDYDEKGGWVARLCNGLYKGRPINHEDSYLTVYNLSVCGDTTKDVLKRFDVETKGRTSDEKDIYVLIELGANDCAYEHEKKGKLVEASKFKENIREMVKKAKELGAKPIVLGILPFEEELLDPCPWATEISYDNKSAKEYEGIIKEVCEEENALFLPMFDFFLENGHKELLSDGVHPNAEGHQKIYERVKAFLEEQKVI